VAELDENFTKMEAAFAVDDTDEVEYLSRQFHRAINLAADSPKLLALLKMTVNQIPRLFYTKLLQGNEWGHVNLEQHAGLLTAFRKGSARNAEAIAVEHVTTAGRLMVEYIALQGYWEEPADDAR
jgi:DNA-binding GntR family transcriptional regulator